MSNASIALKTERRHTATLPLSVLDADGKVIISTLPSGPASGAELFARLHSLERARFAAEPETLQSKRLLLGTNGGRFLIFAGLRTSCGVMIGAKIENIPVAALCHAAYSCGFEEIALRRSAKPSVALLQREDIDAAASFVSHVIEIEQLFESSGRIDLSSAREAEGFLNKFARLTGNTAKVRIEGISDLSLLEEIDGKALGIAIIIASALSGEDKALSVTLSERSKRLWADMEIAPRKTRGRSKVNLDELERICGGLRAFECKNFHISQEGTTVRISYSPTVFDPTADGLMQDNDINRQR